MQKHETHVHFKLDFIKEANTMSPDQTAPWEQSDTGSYCLHYQLHLNNEFNFSNVHGITLAFQEIKVFMIPWTDQKLNLFLYLHFIINSKI